VIRQQMLSLINHNYFVADIRARMIARQRSYERMQARQNLLRRHRAVLR
jgi:hypothetical protein